MWRGYYPLQSCLVPCHVACPTFHGYYGQLAFVLIVSGVEVECQFARCLTVEVRNLELAHERDIAVFHEVALNLVAAEWVGAIENDQLFAMLDTCFHEHAQCGDIGV